MAEQFPWLVDTLLQARSRGEKVLLLRHCPVSDFSEGFDRLMMNITDEFSDIIVASFAGHAHTSWLTVLRDQATLTQPVDVTYVSGSGTPGGGNPAFRVYHYDLDTYEITDYDQYWVYMDRANREGKATWIKDHSAREHYGLSDLSGASWTALANSWLAGNDHTISWQRYARAMTRDRDPAKKQDRVREACTILSVDATLFKKCMNDTSAEFAPHDEEHGSSIPIEMAQVLVEATMTRDHEVLAN